MLPAHAGKKIRGPTVNLGPCPGVALTLCAIMSTDQTGGAAAAGAVWACLSWAWGRLCWCWCCPGAVAFRLYFTVLGDSSPACFFPSVPAASLLFPSIRPASLQSMQSGRGVLDFALLFFALSLFSLVYPPFSSDIPFLFVLFTCYSLSECLFYCILFYAIAARLIWARAPLCVLIAGFSPGRVVRCIMSAFSLVRARI